MELRNPFSSARHRPRPRYVNGFVTLVAGIILLAVGIALFATLIDLWPVVDRGKDASVSDEVGATLFLFYKDSFALNTGLFVLTIVAGALGAYVHAATSFVTFVGNRTFKTSWLWWYGLRLPIGGALALILYFVFRGGLLPGYDATDEINPYGVAALSAFAGLFSKQATDKLKEVFDVMFRTPADQGDDARADKAADRKPEIAGFEPPELEVGATALKVLGARFEEHAKVLVAGKDRSTTYVNCHELDVTLDTGDTQSAGPLSITVSNPPPGKPTSDAATIPVVAADGG